jgi:hypothetical protein
MSYLRQALLYVVFLKQYDQFDIITFFLELRQAAFILDSQEHVVAVYKYMINSWKPQESNTMISPTYEQPWQPWRTRIGVFQDSYFFLQLVVTIDLHMLLPWLQIFLKLL